MKQSEFRENKERVRRYFPLRGADFRIHDMENGAEGRFAYLENVYRDTTRGTTSGVETIPGFRRVFRAQNEIQGIHFYQNQNEGRRGCLVHTGTELWRWEKRELTRNLPAVTRIAEADAAIGQVASKLRLANGVLLVESGGSNRATETLLFRQSLARGTYTLCFSDRYGDGTHAMPFSFLLATASGYTVPFGIGETVHFDLAADGWLTLSVVFDVPQGMAGVWECTVTLTGGEAGSVLLSEEMARARSTSFQVGDYLYLLDGVHYLVYDGASVQEVTAATVPVVMEVLKSGKRVERQRNLLTDFFENRFYVKETSQDAADFRFRLSSRTAEVTEVCYLRADGTRVQLESEEDYRVQDGVLELTAVRFTPTTQDEVDKLPYHGPFYMQGDFTGEVNLCVRCKQAWDDSVSPSGKPAFSKKYGGFGEAITGCRLAAMHEGRIFLSGNPLFPHVIFYSAEGDATFFGTFDYVEDGVGDNPICGLCACGDVLVASLGGNGRDGAIYYHSGKASGDAVFDRVYPGVPTAHGVYTAGGCVTYGEEPVFLTKDGVFALSRVNTFGERKVLSRSTYLGARLVGADMRGASLATWGGYLCILLADGSLYLGDARGAQKDAAGVLQYEWYYVSEVGAYTEETFVVPDGYTAAMEAVGGTFAPPTCLVTDGENLYFGCADGSICAFWFDARGADGRFLPHHYTKNHRRHPSALLTARDDCGAPQLYKRTVPHSTLVETGGVPYTDAKLYVRTDFFGTLPLGSLAADGLDFAALAFTDISFAAATEQILVRSELSHLWQSKQYLLRETSYGGMCALAALLYSYRVCGRYRSTIVR